MEEAAILALVGPTGSGKTALSLELAEYFGAEIINADSRQVYRGLDIGSAKPTLLEQERARHHLLDVVDPDEPFDCARFRELALAAMADIRSRGRRILLVGGTGLYVKVLRGGLFAGPPRDQALRTRLEAEESAHPGSLHSRLLTVDPATAARVHPNDRVRLVRALEVFEVTGRPISEWQREHAFSGGGVPIEVRVLERPRDDLYLRIDRRCEEMLRQGLVEEVQHLLTAGYAPTLPSLQSLGYREVAAHLRGEIDLPVALARMQQATRNFAKRQQTWFRGDPSATWLPPQPGAWWREAARLWGGSV